MVSPERLDQLQRDWVRLLAPFGVGPAAAYPPFDRLVAAYSEPHRHYHTLEHLAEMFRVVGRLANPDDPTNAAAARLAVWYHDAVYDTRAKDNEARSADMAGRELTALGLPFDLIDEVRELIRLTDHLNPPPAVNGVLVMVLDADLAILGASEVRYQRYAADIRKEYDWVPDDLYRVGRVRVLRRFLDSPLIYHTAVMVEVGEAAARRNLAAELATLEAG